MTLKEWGPALAGSSSAAATDCAEGTAPCDVTSLKGGDGSLLAAPFRAYFATLGASGKGDLIMNAVAGVVAGFLVIGGAVALYRFGARKADELRRAIDELRGERGAAGGVIDFERDPATGVFKPKL